MSGLVDLQKALDKFPVQDMTGHEGKVDATIWVLKVDDWLETFKELFSAFQKEYDKQPHPSRKQLSDMVELLEEVVEKRGAYSRDQMTHAENVIENASERAKKVTDKLKELLSASPDEKPHYFSVPEAREKLKEGQK